MNNDATFRQLTQDALSIWNEREPEKTLKVALNRLLTDLTTQIFRNQPISAAISLHDEKRDRLRIELAVGPSADDIERNPPRPSGLTAHVFQRRERFISSAIDSWPDGVPMLRPSLQGSKAIQSIAMFPLLFGQMEQEQAIGVLVIASPHPLTVDSDQIEATTLFADRAALLVQMARVHRRRLSEEQAIARISRFAAGGSPETVAKVIARQAVTLTKSVYAVVFSSSGKRGQLQSMGVASEQGEAQRDLEINLSLDDTSINTQVYNTHEAYYARDLANEPYYYHYKNWDEGTLSAYCVPLLIGTDTVVGTLYVANQHPDGFSNHDRDFIDTLAFHAASALRGTRLLSNVSQFQLAISDVLPAEAQFTQIREELSRTGLDTTGLFIATYSEEANLIEFPKVRHRDILVADDDPLRRPGALYGMRQLNERNGLVDWVINNRTSLLIRDFEIWCNNTKDNLEDKMNRAHMDERETLQCCLVVPMYSQDQIVGALGLRSYTETGLFNEYDQQFLEVVANHIAVVIENSARYTKEVRQRDFQLKIAALQSALADTIPIPQQMTQIRVELQQLGIDISGLFIATYDIESQTIALPKVYDRGILIPQDEKEPGTRYGPRKLGTRMGLIDWCIRHEPQPIHVPDFLSWSHQHEIDPEFKDGVKCFLMAPMYRGETIIGVIGLRGYKKANMFDDSHRELLSELAHFMAIIVENAQILETAKEEIEAYNKRLQRQLQLWQALSRFQREISDIDPSKEEIEDIWHCAQSSLREVGVDPSYLYLALYEDGVVSFPRVFEAGKLVASGTPHRPPYQDRVLGQRKDLTEWVLNHGEPLRFQNRAEMETFRTQHADLEVIPEFSRSWIGVPIKKGERLFGMLAIRSFDKDNAFDEPLEEFMTSIASQAAIVLENARLFDETKAKTRFNHALAQTGRSIASAGLEIDRVLETILRQAVEVTNARFGTFQLVQGELLNVEAIWPADMRSVVCQQLDQISIDGPGITAKAVREGEAQLVHNVAEDPSYIPIVAEIRSELAVVVRGVGEKSGQVIGVINVEHEEAKGLTQSHRDLLINLSRSAAVAIDYAAQYQALERARDIGLASTAIAWLGLFGAEWQHTINQKTFGISNYVAGLRLHLQRIEKISERSSTAFGDTRDGDLSEPLTLLHQGLDRIKEVVDEIREVEFTREVQLPPSITETLVMSDGQNNGSRDSSDNGSSLATRTPTGSALLDSELPRIVPLWCRNHPHVELKYELSCPTTKVGIAPQWLKVALEKLVSNALKVMPDGGVLTIQTWGEREHVAIAICDTGPGIPEEIQPYFLKRVIPNEASKSVGSDGSGMGAMIARFVALSHGGDLVWKNGMAENGTELVMTLPILDGPPLSPNIQIEKP